MTDSFVVVLPFSEDLESIVLVRRAKPPFPGRHNGPGGEVEAGEAPLQAAFRELREETGLLAAGLIPSSSGERLSWIGTLALPYNRKYPEAAGCEGSPAASIHYYAGRLAAGAAPRTVEERNQVATFPVHDVLYGGEGAPILAGNGNLEWAIREALCRLRHDAD